MISNVWLKNWYGNYVTRRKMTTILCVANADKSMHVGDSLRNPSLRSSVWDVCFVTFPCKKKLGIDFHDFPICVLFNVSLPAFC